MIDAESALQIGASSPAALDRTLHDCGCSTPSARARIVGVVENMPSLMGLGATATLYQFNPQIAKTPLINLQKAIFKRMPNRNGLNRLTNIALKRRFLDEQFDQNTKSSPVTNAFAGLALAFIISWRWDWPEWLSMWRAVAYTRSASANTGRNHATVTTMPCVTSVGRW